MDGGRDNANPSPPLREGSPGKCEASRAGKTREYTHSSSDLQKMPLKGGDPLCDGEDVLVLGHRPGCFVSTNYAAPPFGGAIQGHKNFRIKGAPDYIAGGEHQEKGNWMPLPLQGGRGAKSYCGEMGCWGKRRGYRLGSFLSTGQWGPPSVGQGWVGSCLKGTPLAIKAELKDGGRGWCGSRMGTMGKTLCGPI